MGPVNIFSEQAARLPLADIVGVQPNEVAQLATIVWQWLVLAALMAWIGVLLAAYRLLTAFKRQQEAEIATVLYMAVERQRRQGWLWLSIILAGSTALFWLRIPSVLPHQPLNHVPDWPALSLVLMQTPEGWLWLTRAALALLAFGCAAVFARSAHRRARRERSADLLASSAQSRQRWHRRGRVPVHSHREWAGGTWVPAYARRQRRLHADSSIPHLTTGIDALEERLLAGRRHTQISLVVVAALLCTFLFPFPDDAGASLPLTALALKGLAMFTLAAWLGGILYLASVLMPAAHVIESAERSQTLVALSSALKPAIIHVCLAIALYSLFSAETHLISFASLLTLLSAPAGWALAAALVLLGVIMLLALYQARRVLPALAQAAWFAAQGTVTSIMGGMDVSRSLQRSQHERQTLANQAERRLTRIVYAQFLLGLLVLLCLVLASAFGGPPAI